MINDLVIIRCTEMWVSVMLTDYPFIPEGSGRASARSEAFVRLQCCEPTDLDYSL